MENSGSRLAATVTLKHAVEPQLFLTSTNLSGQSEYHLTTSTHDAAATVGAEASAPVPVAATATGLSALKDPSAAAATKPDVIDLRPTEYLRAHAHPGGNLSLLYPTGAAAPFERKGGHRNHASDLDHASE